MTSFLEGGQAFFWDLGFGKSVWDFLKICLGFGIFICTGIGILWRKLGFIIKCLGFGDFFGFWDFIVLSVKHKTGVAAVLQLSLVVYTLEKLRLILSFCHLILVVHLSLV